MTVKSAGHHELWLVLWAAQDLASKEELKGVQQSYRKMQEMCGLWVNGILAPCHKDGGQISSMHQN